MNRKQRTLCGLFSICFGVTFCSSAPIGGDKPTPDEVSANAFQPAVPDPAIMPQPVEAPLVDLEQLNEFVLSNDSKRNSIPLVKRCQRSPTASPYCFTIINRDSLEHKTKQKPKKTRVRLGRERHRPIFFAGSVSNWDKLKQANVNYMIRVFSRLKSDQLSLMKQFALKNSGCPNNPAIAVAATLEDFLPDSADPIEIASLYEKGAECLAQSPPDQEIFFTRAGLFYFIKKQYAQAALVFEKAKNIEVPYVGRPLYWLGRCYVELKEKKKAAMITETLRARYPFSFHTLVAATTDKVDPGEVLNSKENSALSRRSQQNPNVNILIDQVETLRKHGYSTAASRVVDWAAAESQGFEPEVRLYVAELKSNSADHLSRISLLSDILYKHPNLVSRQSMDLYFPKAFYPVFESNVAGIDPNLLLAVARQESAFNPKARSIANARGLLQLLPKTSRKFKKGVNLYDPESNVDVGSRYLFELLKRLNGNIPFALASYNAGPERVSTWTNRYPVDNPVLFTDLIPFRETRDYVASVLRNYYWYRRMDSAGDEKFVDLVFEAEMNNKAIATQ